MRKKVFLSLVFFWGICMFGIAQNYQEVVYLKNGSIIKGVIVEQIPGVSLKVKTADGSIFAYSIDEVEKTTKEEITQRTNNYGIKNGFRPRGYRGFVELGGATGVGDYGDGVFSFSTSHGYQINPYFYLGLGLGLDYHTSWEIAIVPVFIDIRTNFIDNSISPFFDIKAGHSLFDGAGLYLNPNIGISFSFSPKFALNLGVGCNIQWAEIYYDYYSYYYGYSSNYYSDEILGGISLKLGIEF
jgi:hypothetical protein